MLGILILAFLAPLIKGISHSETGLSEKASLDTDGKTDFCSGGDASQSLDRCTSHNDPDVEVEFITYQRIMYMDVKGRSGSRRLGSFIIQNWNKRFNMWEDYRVNGRIWIFQDTLTDPNTLIRFTLPVQLSTDRIRLVPQNVGGCINLFIRGCPEDENTSPGVPNTTPRPTTTTRPQPTTTNGGCGDLNMNCRYWASIGQCESNPGFMLINCRESCDACGPDPDCSDRNENCGYWASIGECERNPGFMIVNCKLTCNMCGKTANNQGISNTDHEAKLPESISEKARDCSGGDASMSLDRCSSSSDPNINVEFITYQRILYMDVKGRSGARRFGSFVIQNWNRRFNMWEDYRVNGQIWVFQDTLTDPNALIRFTLPVQLSTDRIRLVPQTVGGCINLFIRGCPEEG